MKELIKFFQKNIITIALLFIILPVIIFLIGYIKWYIAVFAICFIAYESYKIIKNEKIDTVLKVNYKVIFVILLILCLWVFFSGIGGFSYQNADFEVRNAVFYDLIHQKWPIIGEINNNYVSGTVGFVYYFTYWLPAALIGKLFGDFAGNVALCLYSVISLCLIVYLINLKLYNDSKNSKRKNMAYNVLFNFLFWNGYIRE
jgi:hypothetical protein